MTGDSCHHVHDGVRRWVWINRWRPVKYWRPWDLWAEHGYWNLWESWDFFNLGKQGRHQFEDRWDDRKERSSEESPQSRERISGSIGTVTLQTGTYPLWRAGATSGIIPAVVGSLGWRIPQDTVKVSQDGLTAMSLSTLPSSECFEVMYRQRSCSLALSSDPDARDLESPFVSLEGGMTAEAAAWRVWDKRRNRSDLTLNPERW